MMDNSPLESALAQFEAVEANLKRLEDVTSELSDVVVLLTECGG